MTQQTGFAYHSDYLNHDTGPNHPERPDRLRASLAALQESEIWERLHPIEPTPASTAQLCYAHEPTYPEHIQHYCEAEMPLTYDTTVVKASFDIAKLSTGGVLRVADAVVTGTVKNGFAMVRTPGLTESEYGVVFVQQYCSCGSLSSTRTRRWKGRDCGLGCPPRKRHTRYFL